MKRKYGSSKSVPVVASSCPNTLDRRSFKKHSNVTLTFVATKQFFLTANYLNAVISTVGNDYKSLIVDCDTSRILELTILNY